VKFFVIITFIINSFFFYDYKNESYDLKENSGINFIIFFDGLSCANCYKKLSNSISQNFENSRIIALAKFQKNIIDRKKIIVRAKEIFNFDILLFDKLESSDNSLFMKYEISKHRKTPVLLCILPDTLYYFSFNDLFSNNNLDSVIFSLKCKLDKKVFE
jgi:hypothetical protein